MADTHLWDFLTGKELKELTGGLPLSCQVCGSDVEDISRTTSLRRVDGETLLMTVMEMSTSHVVGYACGASREVRSAGPDGRGSRVEMPRHSLMTRGCPRAEAVALELLSGRTA